MVVEKSSIYTSFKKHFPNLKCGEKDDPSYKNPAIVTLSLHLAGAYTKSPLFMNHLRARLAEKRFSGSFSLKELSLTEAQAAIEIAYYLFLAGVLRKFNEQGQILN